MNRTNLAKIVAVVAAMILIILAAAAIVFLNHSDAEPPANDIVSMFGESDAGGEESGTIKTNPDDDGFGTEVGM